MWYSVVFHVKKVKAEYHHTIDVDVWFLNNIYSSDANVDIALANIC